MKEDKAILVWNEVDERFEAHFGGAMAWIDYEPTAHGLALLHTEVPEELTGHGYSQLLARFALDSARSRGMKVVVYCPTVQHFIQKHPEYATLMDETFHLKK